MLKKAVFLLLAFVVVACAKDPVPKPTGDLRLEYPTGRYRQLTSDCPYTFEYSQYAEVLPGKQNCWFYVNYPNMKARVFITYFPIRNDFSLHVKEAEKMVYEHTIKASAIKTKTFNYPDHKVYGSFYELKGQSASNIQFYATDSTRHFVTANLYFNSRPKPDSLAPAVDYIKKDILHMLDTFKWKQ